MQYPQHPVLTSRARWIPAVLYMALIFYASAQSDPAPVLTRNVWDKLLHAGGYGVLAALYVWALAGGTRTARHIALLAIVLTSLYAASDEFHQRFTPGRQADVYDWCADTIGGTIAAGALTVSRVLRRLRPLPP